MDKIDTTRWHSISDNNAKNWTPAAIECYEHHCTCSKCPVSEYIKNCRMKYSVIQLIAKFGISKKISKRRVDEDILLD